MLDKVEERRSLSSLSRIFE